MDPRLKTPLVCTAVLVMAAGPVYQLWHHGQANMLKDRAPVAISAVSSSASSTASSAILPSAPQGNFLVQNMVLGGHHDTRPIDSAIPYFAAPKEPGSDDA